MGCVCKADGPCNCCTPRAPRNRRQSKASRKSDREESDTGVDGPHEPAGLVVSAHNGDYRPVLPRPASTSRSSPPRNSHSPSGGPHVPRGQLFFSPYGRAYEHAHGADIVQASELAAIPSTSNFNQASQLLPNPVPENYAPPREDMPSFMSDWLSSIQQSNVLPPPIANVMCNCGPNCACPGCVIHQGSAAVFQAFASCTNPSSCNACLECSMLTLTPNPALDEWFRQLNASSDSPQDSAPNSTIATPPQQMFPDVAESLNQELQPDMRFDPAAWQSYALWNNLQGQPAAPSPPEDCCSGQCKCSPGICNCPADCCGCCQGCSCADCVHEDRTMGNGKTLTFAVSGERGACCGRRSPHHLDITQQAGPSSGPSAMDSDTFRGGLDLRGIYELDSSSSDLPRTSLSRASSASSRSSSHRSQHSSTHSQRSVHRGAIAPADPVILAPAVKSCCASLATMNTSAPSSTSPRRTSIPSSPPPAAVVQERTYPYDNTDIGSARMF